MPLTVFALLSWLNSGDDLHADQIVVEHVRRDDERRAEAVERRLLRPDPFDADDRRDGKFAA